MDLREIADHPIRRHPWETARASYFRAVLETVDRPVSSILDAGSGDGWLSGELRRVFPHARLTCWDSGYEDGHDEAADQSPRDAIVYTAERPTARFDLILLMDVLEHLDDDLGFMTSLVKENAADDGVFLVCVPAWPFLFSSHDATFSHRRRYSPSQLRTLLLDAGLEIVDAGDMFQSLMAPRFLSVLRERAAGTSRTAHVPQVLKWSHGETLARAIETFFDIEGQAHRFLRRFGIRLPGLSTWALCRKKPQI